MTDAILDVILDIILDVILDVPLECMEAKREWMEWKPVRLLDEGDADGGGATTRTVFERLERLAGVMVT